VLIAIATAVLLAAGAGALAIARTDSRQPTFQPPLGAAAPFGIGYVDGFGEHTPTPSPTGRPSRRPPKSPTFGDHPSTAPVVGLVSSPSSGTILTEASPTGDPKPAVSELSAVYWATTWQGTYEIYVWVHNEGPDAAPWQITMQLQPNATISRYWEAEGVSVGKDTWQFTSTKGTALGAGRTYLFAFEGKRGTGPFRVYSCSVNTISCTSFW
jgi:hypothetical protein